MFDKKRMYLVADTNSKVVHFSKLGCELFSPAIITNKESSTTAVELGVIAVNTLLVELQDTRKATSTYLSSMQGEYCWGNTTSEYCVA